VISRKMSNKKEYSNPAMTESKNITAKWRPGARKSPKTKSADRRKPKLKKSTPKTLT